MVLSEFRSKGQGYTVKEDTDCTEKEAIEMLKDKRVKAFVFIGHANESELGMRGGSDWDESGLDAEEVKSALGGRRMERVDLRGCNTDSKT